MRRRWGSSSSPATGGSYVLVAEDEPLADLAYHFQPALIGDRDRVDRRSRHADAGLDRRPGFTLAGRARADRGGTRAPAGGQDATQQRHRQSGHRAPPQELPPGQPPRHELVDDVLLDRATPRPQGIQPSVVNLHWTSWAADMSHAATGRDRRPSRDASRERYGQAHKGTSMQCPVFGNAAGP